MFLIRHVLRNEDTILWGRYEAELISKHGPGLVCIVIKVYTGGAARAHRSSGDDHRDGSLSFLFLVYQGQTCSLQRDVELTENTTNY